MAQKLAIPGTWRALVNEKKVVEPAALKIGPLLRVGEWRITGAQAVIRARGDGTCCQGINQAEALLDHLERIPAEWCTHSLLFLGTIWADEFDHPYAAEMYCDFGEWKIQTYCLDDSPLDKRYIFVFV